jgi:hypothetical protein
MPNKLFIFHVRPGKYENTLEISYQQSDLDLMAELIDQQKGYGRIYIQTSRRTGKPYAEIRQPEGSTPAGAPPAETTPAASPDASPAEGSSAAIPPTPPVDDTETPF